MNILFIADPNSHDIKWLEELSRENNCFLLLREEHYKRYSKSELDEIESRYSVRIVGSISDFSLPRIGRTLKSFRKILKVIKEFGIDIFHIMYAEPNALWALFRRKWNIPIIVTTRGTDVLRTIPAFCNSRNPWKKVISLLYKAAFNSVDNITCTSETQKRSITQLFNYPDKKVHIVRTGVDYNRLLNLHECELPIELDGRKYILFPRSMRPLYNHEFSIRAIEKLSLEIKQGFSFVFIDKDSPDHDYVSHIKSLMELQTDCNFVFLKRQKEEQIFCLYRNATLVVMNPLSDGTPVSALEAIAFKKPVILGPLNYDIDLFGEYELKLTAWNEAELAFIIESVIREESKLDKDVVFQFFQERTNRKDQMSVINVLYKDLKKNRIN